MDYRHQPTQPSEHRARCPRPDSPLQAPSPSATQHVLTPTHIPDSGTFPTDTIWEEDPEPGVRAGSQPALWQTGVTHALTLGRRAVTTPPGAAEETERHHQAEGGRLQATQGVCSFTVGVPGARVSERSRPRAVGTAGGRPPWQGLSPACPTPSMWAADVAPTGSFQSLSEPPSILRHFDGGRQDRRQDTAATQN